MFFMLRFFHFHQHESSDITGDNEDSDLASGDSKHEAVVITIMITIHPIITTTTIITHHHDAAATLTGRESYSVLVSIRFSTESRWPRPSRPSRIMPVKDTGFGARCFSCGPTPQAAGCDVDHVLDACPRSFSHQTHRVQYRLCLHGAGRSIFSSSFREPGGLIGNSVAGWGLAFSAGVFLCIALSDLLPEMEFHSHHRVPLSFLCFSESRWHGELDFSNLLICMITPAGPLMSMITIHRTGTIPIADSLRDRIALLTIDATRRASKQCVPTVRSQQSLGTRKRV